MKFSPLHDRVLLRRLVDEERTAGGIIIPDAVKEKPKRAEVVAVGTGVRLENGTVQPLDVAIGDIVLIGDYAGSEVKFDGEEFVIVRENEIYGVANCGAQKP